MFGSASPGNGEDLGVADVHQVHLRASSVSFGARRLPGNAFSSARISGESTGNETVLAAQKSLGEACSGASLTMRSASSASRSADAQTFLPGPRIFAALGRRLSAVTMPPCALFMKMPVPPPFSRQIRS